MCDTKTLSSPEFDDLWQYDDYEIESIEVEELEDFDLELDYAISLSLSDATVEEKPRTQTLAEQLRQFQLERACDLSASRKNREREENSKHNRESCLFFILSQFDDRYLVAAEFSPLDYICLYRTCSVLAALCRTVVKGTFLTTRLNSECVYILDRHGRPNSGPMKVSFVAQLLGSVRTLCYDIRREQVSRPIRTSSDFKIHCQECFKVGETTCKCHHRQWVSLETLILEVDEMMILTRFMKAYLFRQERKNISLEIVYTLKWNEELLTTRRLIDAHLRDIGYDKDYKLRMKYDIFWFSRK